MLIRNKKRRSFIIQSLVFSGILIVSSKIKINKILFKKEKQNKNYWMLHSDDY
tara:strand:+ start:182 stop:340 length:159 start_codon:yes stop_codon:yes gene_type:complete